MKTFEEEIIKLQKEKSEKNYPLWGALKIVGGLAMFVVAAFVSPGLLPVTES